MPVQFRNTNPGPVVFHDPLTKQQVEWAGAGDRNGEDYQYVSDEMASQNVQFRKVVRMGHLEQIEEMSTEAQEAMLAQVTAGRAAAANTGLAGVMLGGIDNDLVALDCVGPAVNGRAGAVCGATVMAKSTKRHEAPPLCDRHQHLKSEFASMVDTDAQIGPDGKPPVRWVRSTVGPMQYA